MNNKLYQKYLSLKIENSDLYYLFKSCDYYFFIAEDAVRIAPLINLNLVPLNSVLMKCEFNINDYKKYINELEKHNLKFKIIYLSNDIFNYDLENCLCSCNFDEMISNFLKVDIDNLSISQAFDLLHELQSKFEKLNK